MPKSTKPRRSRAGGKSRSLTSVKPQSTALALPDTLRLGVHHIRPEQILQIPERRPYGEGPWESEPDRVAWIDAASRYHCLILRQPSGALAGYVAVGPEHPLWGYLADAIPTELGLTVHRGLTYSATCQKNDPPAVRVCHPHDDTRFRGVKQQSVPGLKDSEGSGASDAWWFGFACEHACDFLPRGYARNDEDREDGPREYRDIAYVADQTVALARQLKALDGNAPIGNEGSAATGVPLALEDRSKALKLRKGGRDHV
ncbi:hypothetical protein [Erythrobacter tepidarius]|uniref:hypothetical protein n=1 Tax=Erythrobacter tepidarius TaxID=60454 RepID=UPI00117C4F5F|nr:hypothetical protein [Erythrobacter tepidarius]